MCDRVCGRLRRARDLCGRLQTVHRKIRRSPRFSEQFAPRRRTRCSDVSDVSDVNDVNDVSDFSDVNGGRGLRCGRDGAHQDTDEDPERDHPARVHQNPKSNPTNHWKSPLAEPSTAAAMKIQRMFSPAQVRTRSEAILGKRVRLRQESA